jgi:amino acid adenylation domain-containing protein
MKNILEDIYACINTYSEKNAFFIQGNSYSYKELGETISKIAPILNCNNKCIGIIESDDIETYASILAVLFTSNTYVILNPHNPLVRNERIISLTSIDLILSTKDNSLYRVLQGKYNCILTSGLNISRPLSLIPAGDKDIAYILFTSGSTGTPKGVPISYSNLNTFYEGYSSLGFKLGPEDRMLQMFDLSFDVSVVSTLYPLSIGASVYTVPLDAVKYTAVYEILEDERITFAAIPPSILTLLRAYFSEISLPDLKYLILTAEASLVEIIKEFVPSIPNAQIVNLYGPSEGTIYCSSYFLNKNNIKDYNGMLSIGKIFPNMHSKIISEKNTVLSNGEKGELCIRGEQVMNAYWQDVEKTDQAFVFIEEKKYYRTGDLCYEDQDGDILYCGRTDHQVQLNGFRVELSEIEHFVRQVHTKGNCVVLPVSNINGSLELHLIVEYYMGEDCDLFKILKENLPPYMQPKRIHKLGEFPLNTSGKIDRPKLKLMIKE